MKKNRETLFTFTLYTAELLSFSQEFSLKVQNSNFGFSDIHNILIRPLAAILGYVKTNVDLPL